MKISAELGSITKALDTAGVPYRVTATTNGTHVNGSRHYWPCIRPATPDGCSMYGLGIDIAGTVSYWVDPTRSKREMDAIFAVLAPMGGRFFELIYSHSDYAIKRGQRVARYAISAHWDHVHAAVSRGVYVAESPLAPKPPPPHPQEGQPMTQTLNRPAVKLLADPLGRGYWEISDDGGVLTWTFEGQPEPLPFHGSLGSTKLSGPIVDAAVRPQGDGYWLLGADGGVFGFGAAEFFGGHGPEDENAPFTSITATPSGNGYWLLGNDGGVFSYGDAKFAGTMLYVPTH